VSSRAARGGPHGRSSLRTWLPVAVWLLLIALESTSAASADNTGSLLSGLFRMALPGRIGDQLFGLVHFLLRKGGHFFGYGIGGLLFFRALRRTAGHWSLALAAWSVVLTAVVAALDEYQQTFLPSRTGSLRDVLLDTCGAVCLLAVNLLWLWMRRRAAPPERQLA